MRLRFRKFDYFKEACDAASAPLFFSCHEEEIMQEESSKSKYSWLRDDLEASSVNVSGLSCTEKLSFARAHTQFLSSIFPQNYEESRAKRGPQQKGIFISDGKKSAIFAKCFELEPPEVDLSQEEPILPCQIMLELGCMPLILIEADLTSCSQQVIFEMKIDNAISLDVCSFLLSSDKVLEDISNYKDSICIEKERDDMNNLMLERCSPGEGKSSKFFKCVGPLFQFEVYEVCLDNYDLQAVREALFLLYPEDKLNRVEQQSTILMDTPELPCSMHFDLFDYFNIEHSLSHISEEHLKFSSTYKGTVHETEISVIHPINSGDNSGTTKGELVTAAQIQIFEVLDLLDGNYMQTFETFTDLMEATWVTFEETTMSNIKSQFYFDELVVIPELILTDSTFKSLPIPVFCEDKEDLSFSVIKILLNQYKQHSTSASDWLYLDWHQSKGGACNNCNCSSIQEKLEDEENCGLIKAIVISIKMTTDVLSAIEYFEQCQDNSPSNSVTEIPESVSISDISGVKDKTVKNIEKEICDLYIETSQKNTLKSSSNVSSLFNSTSVSSDLSFFLNARRGSTRGRDTPAKEISDRENSLCHHLYKPSNLNVLSNGNSQKTRVQLHHVAISTSVLEILDSLQAKFDMVIALDHDLKRVVDIFPNLNKLCFLNSSQVHLMSLIKDRASNKKNSDFDCVLKGLVTMHVLQKTAFHVCFYGVRVAHFYTKKLVQSIDFLEDSIQPPYSLLKDVYHKSEKGLIEENPMMSSLERILKSDFSPQCGQKILLVAERKLFLTLHKKMTAMNLKLHEFLWTDKLRYQLPDCREKSQFKQAVLDALAHCDCLLASHKNVNGSFPFEQFNIIVEYDDSHLSSHVSYTIGRIAHACNIHLMRVEVKGKIIVPLFTEALTNHANSITEDIFEGEDSFLTEVIEVSDDLYASAVGLGIHLQCFLSGSSETTDHIVLNCIRTSSTSREVSYPAMMESETLGECFLLKFPSMNPLTAHVVLSCADTLSEFICLTHERQMHSMRKFDTPEKSVILFISHCKHGELGETKSCTTDCSSTLTSPFDEDSNFSRTEINSDKPHTAVNIHSEDIPGNDCLGTDMSALSFHKDNEISMESFKLKPSQISQRTDKQPSMSFEWVDNHNHPTNNQHLTGLNWGCTLDHDTGYSNSDLIDQLNPPPVMKNSCGDAYGESVSIYKDLQKETFGKPQCNFSSGFFNSKFNTEYPLSVSLGMRNAGKTANSDVHQMKQIQSNLQQFSSSTNVNCQLDPWHSSNEALLGNFDAGETRKQPQMKNTIANISSSLERDCWHDETSNWKQKSIRNAFERSQLTKHEKNYSNSTNAFIGKGSGSSYVQQKLRGSKKILHAVPNDYSSAGDKKSVLEYPSCVSSFCPGSSPGHKSRSPSILDNYQYQSGVESRIACKRKWQNLLMYPKKSPGMKRQKNSASSSLQSWTPVEKRAKL
ncbi:hypothetical protein KI387_013274, partial [Taxus chinensis]